MRDRILRDCHRLSRHQCDTICYADNFADVSKMIAMPASDTKVPAPFVSFSTIKEYLMVQKSNVHYLHSRVLWSRFIIKG